MTPHPNPIHEPFGWKCACTRERTPLPGPLPFGRGEGENPRSAEQFEPLCKPSWVSTFRMEFAPASAPRGHFVTTRAEGLLALPESWKLRCQRTAQGLGKRSVSQPVRHLTKSATFPLDRGLLDHGLEIRFGADSRRRVPIAADSCRSESCVAGAIGTYRHLEIKVGGSYRHLSAVFFEFDFGMIIQSSVGSD